jgi:uncharacterized cupin superfamily protein
VELGDGIFVSSLATQDFAPDPDVPGTEQHILFERGQLSAGLSRVSAAAEPVVWTLPNREVILVVEGAARIDIKDGPTIQLGVGDMASLPKGAETTWHLTVPFKEFWVLG